MSKTAFNIFYGYSYSRTVACCGHLTSNQEVLIYTTQYTHE